MVIFRKKLEHFLAGMNRTTLTEFVSHHHFDHYFVHSFQDVTCPEAVKLDDLDSAEVQKQFDAAKSAFSSAGAGTPEQAEAQIDMEVNKAMGLALGLSLS